MSVFIHSKSEIAELYRTLYLELSKENDDNRVFRNLIHTLWKYEQITFSEKYSEHIENEELTPEYLKKKMIQNQPRISAIGAIKRLDSMNYQIEADRFQERTQQLIYMMKELLIMKNRFDTDSLEYKQDYDNEKTW